MAAKIVSIKTKITVTLVLLPLISLVIVGTIALWQNQQSLADQAESNLQRLVLEKTLGYNHIFQRIHQEVEAVADYAEMMSSQDTPTVDLQRKMLLPWTGKGYGNKEIQKTLHNEIVRLQRVGQTLQAIVSNNPYLTLGYMGTETGITVFDNEDVVSIIEELEAFDVRTRPWYIQAKEKSKTIWTDLYVDANTKKLTVTAATPISRTDGSLLGVVGFDVLLETLQDDILSMDIGYINTPFMIDSRGNVLLRPGMDLQNTEWDKTYKTDNLQQTENPAFNQIIGKMITGSAAVELYANPQGEQEYLAFAPIETIGASVGIIVPRSEIVRPVQESGKLVIIALAIIIIIALGVGLILSNQVTKPIEELTVIVDKASRGIVEVEKIPITRKDEIGILAGSFNRMVDNLAIVMRELETRERKE
jgi:two-component system sensor histidine kinase/response regulator